MKFDSKIASANKSLGTFILDGIPPAPRGIPQVEVKFDIDANGILHVSAKDKASGKEQKITIQGSTGLSDEEINQMVSDAEKHKEEDAKKKKLIEAKNMAESLIYTSEKTISDNKDKIDATKKTELEGKISELKELLKTSQEEEVIKSKTEELSKLLQEIGASLYQNPNNAQGPNASEPNGSKPDANNGSSKNDGDVVEGTVE
jgi:molecular chaperone DnaK